MSNIQTYISRVQAVNSWTTRWKALLPKNNPKLGYELSNIIERWLMIDASVHPRMDSFSKSMNDLHTAKMWSELLEKKCLKPNDRQKWEKEMKLAFGSSHSVELNLKITDNIVQLTDDIKMKILPNVLDELRKLNPSDDELYSLVARYLSINPGSQHWSASDAIFSEQMAKHDLDTEGFASPFNSYLIRSGLKRSDPSKYRIFSLFPEDKDFGCEHDFFTATLTGHRVFVNPPFIESMLEQAAVRCIQALRDDVDTVIVFYGPKWDDAKFYQLLSTSSYLESITVLNRNTYELFTADGVIQSRVDNVMWVLSG